MNWVSLTSLSILTYIILMYAGARYLVQDKVPPRPVRFAAMLEVAFGTIIFGCSGLVLNEKDHCTPILLMLAGLLWIGMGVSLDRGSKLGRIMCLVLSVLRCLTVIGAVFSLLSIYKLFVPKESKDFFNQQRPRAPHAQR